MVSAKICAPPRILIILKQKLKTTKGLKAPVADHPPQIGSRFLQAFFYASPTQ